MANTYEVSVSTKKYQKGQAGLAEMLSVFVVWWLLFQSLGEVSCVTTSQCDVQKKDMVLSERARHTSDLGLLDQ